MLDYLKNAGHEVSRMALLTDTLVYESSNEVLEKGKPSHSQVILHPSGEQGKSWEALGRLLEAMLRAGLDRNSVLIVAGGGALCDVGGLAAALYMRGVRCVYVPTTLLAMVDAAIGGKTAVNMGPYKNMIGVFRMPEAVWCDTRFLETLPETALLEGLAEMIKHGLVADSRHAQRLFELASPCMLTSKPELIRESQQIKLGLVEKDPQDRGPRSLLNFGHTVGHALEGHYAAQNQPVPHGLCVAAGMLAEISLSVQVTGLDAVEADTLKQHIKLIFRGRLPAWPGPEALLPFILKDKKNKQGSLRFVLLEKTGKAVRDCQVSADNVIKTLQHISFEA